MKKCVLFLFGIVFFLISPLIVNYSFAQFYPQPQYPQITIAPDPCRSGNSPGSYCPDPSQADPNANNDQINNYQCADDYEEWLSNKTLNFWVEDPEVTALGKGGERSRQFLLWTLTHPSIDDHPVIMDVWKLSRSIATFFILIVAIIMGIGIIIGQRSNFETKIEIAPLIIQIFILLLFVMFSARIILLIVQISDIMMEFFIKTLGVKELFNIFFVQDSSGRVIVESEKAYREFVGCTNWNINNVEMVKTSKFMIKFTNMTYYFIGIMMIVRKIVLWFLMIISPFIVILAPFVFIRNIGWIWIGVFFQWVFYGPMFALFLGSLARIWNSPPVHIPFIFDFSRTHIMSQVVYPTSINILYGGPAQTLGIWNTSNYVDTFAEYIISLVMLWTVLILPWWLLRIFRDYCCDGIYGMKNVLTSMADNIRTLPPPPGGPSAPTVGPQPVKTTGISQYLTQQIRRDIDTSMRLTTLEEIKKARTEDIVKSVNVKASTIADIARFETSKSQKETINRNMNLLSNPLKAETVTERQRFMNVRNEIFTRAGGGDKTAQTTASVFSSSATEKQLVRQRIVQSIPAMVPVIKNIAVKVDLPEDKTSAIIQKIFNMLAYNSNIVTNISATTGITQQQTVSVLQNLAVENTLTKPTNELLSSVAKVSGVTGEQVKGVLEQAAQALQKDKDIKKEVAKDENVDEDTVDKVAEKHLKATSKPEENLEENMPASSKVSLEDYEDVKSMWKDQYEHGEVPLSYDIKDRKDWINQDIITITNIINKLLSPNPQLKNEALTDIGFILPIFMINNMTGEELLVYLRAKLEAAKQVKEQLETEKEQKDKVSKEEEFIEVKGPVKIKPKVKTAEESLKMEIPQDANKEKTDVDKGGSKDDIEKIKQRLSAQEK